MAFPKKTKYQSIDESISEFWWFSLVVQWKFGPIKNRRPGLSRTPCASTPLPLGKLLRRLKKKFFCSYLLFLFYICVFFVSIKGRPEFSERNRPGTISTARRLDRRVRGPTRWLEIRGSVIGAQSPVTHAPTSRPLASQPGETAESPETDSPWIPETLPGQQRSQCSDPQHQRQSRFHAASEPGQRGGGRGWRQ